MTATTIGEARRRNERSGGGAWSPAMADVPLRGAWYWQGDHAAKRLDKLVDIYVNSVGRNCNLVLGEVITPEGLISGDRPEGQVVGLLAPGLRLEHRGREVFQQAEGIGMQLHSRARARST